MVNHGRQFFFNNAVYANDNRKFGKYHQKPESGHGNFFTEFLHTKKPSPPDVIALKNL